MSSKKLDIHRSKGCDECPREKQWRQTREQTLERWEKWFEDDEADLDFDAMVTTLNRIRSLETLSDDRITVKNAQLRAIVQNEEARAANRRMSNPAA